jgi:sugar phosphate isomerase/epimerase
MLEVRPASGGMPVDWRKDNDTFKAGLAALPKLAEAAKNIGCGQVCTWLPPSISADPAEFRAQSAVRFREIAIVLNDYGIRFGLEFVGPKTARVGPKAMGPNEFIYTIPQTLDLIADINAPGDNVGLLVDSFHWFCTGSDLKALGSLTAKQVVHVHINDAPDRPLDEQLDFERLLPGEGIIDLAGFFGTLKRIGYTGFAAVETFSADLKAMGQEKAAAATGAAIEKIHDLLV